MSKLLIILMSFNILLADPSPTPSTCPNAVVLHKGDSVKDCDRIGLSVNYDKQVRQDLVEGDFNKKLNQINKQIQDAQEDRYNKLAEQSKLWQDQAVQERDNYTKEREVASRNIWIGIGVGVLMTILTGFMVKQVVK